MRRCLVRSAKVLKRLLFGKRKAATAGYTSPSSSKSARKCEYRCDTSQSLPSPDRTTMKYSVCARPSSFTTSAKSTTSAAARGTAAP